MTLYLEEETAETVTPLPFLPMRITRREDRPNLLFVAVEAVEGSERAEEAVVFIVDAGGEKQGVRGSGSRVISESERQQDRDGQKRIIGILKEADEFVGEAVECGDPAATEIADEDGVAELAEIARGPHGAPGSVEPIAMLEVADVLAAWREQLDEAEAIAADGVVPRGVLLGIGDEERASNVLNVEGSETAGDAFCTMIVAAAITVAVGIEGIFAEVHALEVGVVDLDFGGAEIGDVEEAVPVDLGGSHAFVDRAVRGAFVGVVHFEDGIGGAGWRINAGIPA